MSIATTEKASSRNGTTADTEPVTFPLDSFREAAPHLRRPFTPAAVKFKVQATWPKNDPTGGLIVAYIDARLAVERLNLIVPHLWYDAYEPVGKGLLCHLTVDGITRRDVGEEQGGVKGLYSDALKRAAVKFGVGVSLYAIPQMRLNASDGHLKRVQTNKGPSLALTPNGETHVRNLYAGWLDLHGRQAFGDPLDHGDSDDAQGDAEVEAPPESAAPARAQDTPPVEVATPADVEEMKAALKGLTAGKIRLIFGSVGLDASNGFQLEAVPRAKVPDLVSKAGENTPMTALTNPAGVEPEAVTTEPWDTPGAFKEHKQRELDTGGVITFEYAPAGWLTQDGEIRQKDHRAYYWTAQPQCPACEGSGRAPSEKRPDGTVKCKPCNGTGEARRERMISVTTLLDAICPKGGLPNWAEARGIEGTVQAVRLGEITASTDPGDAVKLVRHLKLGADHARDTAADRGINCHALVEHYMRTGEPPRHNDHPVEHHGYLTSICGWLLKRDPEPEQVEQLVCNPQAGYAGRRDLVARADGFRIGWDFKTQERGQIFSGAHLQLKLYEDAAVACGDDPCDFLKVVVFPADGGEAREMECAATDQSVRSALAFYEDIKPINSLCEGWNRAARKERA